MQHTDIDQLASHIRALDWRVAVAESLTCGALAQRLGAASDAVDWLAGGVVAYQLRTKHRVLGVDADVDPCSARCAEQLARGVRRLLGADVAVSVTGVGGPEPDGGHAPGTVYVGWDTADGTGHTLVTLDGDVDAVLTGAVDAAVAALAACVRETARSI